MLSFGSAALLADGTMVGTFTANLETLDGATGHPSTMEFWANNHAAWNETRTDLQHPIDAMSAYVTWLKALPGIPVFVGYPAAYDFLFVYWYLMNFVGESPFSHSALDIKTFAMALTGKPYRGSTKRNMPKRWLPESPHTHVAIDDAIEQGQLFINMLKERPWTRRSGRRRKRIAEYVKDWGTAGGACICWCWGCGGFSSCSRR